ncbi:MAG: CHAT domain-containing protein, partial [Armatimonadota bacterium]
MFGRYGKGQQTMPRVMHLSIARYQADLPKPGAPLEFLVTIHEEGTGISWQQNVAVDADTEQWLLAATGELHQWSVRKKLTPDNTRVRVEELGTRLYKTFVTTRGEEVLASIVPTAVLLDIDETILNLPWELIATTHGPISQRTPFGRLVATRVIPRRGRDPLQEDAVVRILAVINPTDDLAAAEMEISTLAELQGNHGAFSVEVTQLRRDEATRARFMDTLAAGDYDILHFAGHAWLDPDEPEASA